MIHFVTVHMKEQIHAQALGFTKAVYLYCWGGDPAEAERHAMAYCLGVGGKPDFCSKPTVAQQQEPTRYTFPEQIHGLPLDMAETAIRAHDFGDSITASTLRDLMKKRDTLRRGLGMLATA